MHKPDLKNKITLDFKENLDLRSVFSNKSPGQKCRLDVEFVLDELTEEGAVGSIRSIKPYGEESRDVDPESPVLLAIKTDDSINKNSAVYDKEEPEEEPPVNAIYG